MWFQLEKAQRLILTNLEANVVNGNDVLFFFSRLFAAIRSQRAVYDVGHKWLGCILSAGPMEGHLWTWLIIYGPPKGHPLPSNKFSVTERFVSHFVSLTGSLHRLPFWHVAIEQSG